MIHCTDFSTKHVTLPSGKWYIYTFKDDGNNTGTGGTKSGSTKVAWFAKVVTGWFMDIR
jgi:hypothetical protein